MPPKTQQARVSEALKGAKSKETLGAGSVSDSDRRMWAALRDQQRSQILELPLADRAMAIRRAYHKTVSAHQMYPGLGVAEKTWQGPGNAQWVGVGAPDSVSGWKFASDPAGTQAREHLMSTMLEPTYERPVELGLVQEGDRQGYLESEGLRGAGAAQGVATDFPGWEEGTGGASSRALEQSQIEQMIRERQRVTGQIADMPVTGAVKKAYEGE